VRTLVEMQEGRVQAQSGGLGKGSEFTVKLPVVADTSGHRARTILQPGKQGGRPLRILVVEDNVDSADSLNLLLRLYGHDVHVARTGPTALEMAVASRPDVVLLDIGLPGMSGYEVARQLRQRPQFEKALLVAVTGYGQDEDRRRSGEAGFDHHLTKPVDPNTLHALLAS
jgi:CheY-like chemotaxis protein